MIIVFVNCKLFPFISWIIAGKKLFETRNRNTLGRFIGKTVYFAETGKGRRPVVRCSCMITELVTVTDRATYNDYRKPAMIKKGSVFDWKETTRKKCLYKLEGVKACEPFPLPENAVYHGRVCATID
jgi:hypothetical protein